MVLNIMGTVAAVVAALAALVTVIYARRTVLDGRDAHRELVAAQAQARDDFATAHREQVAEQAQARAESAAAHREQMAERQHALAADISLQRLIQAGLLAEVLTAIARAAREETLTPPGPAAGSQRATFIPTLQAQLRAVLALFYALGGPRLADAAELAQKAYSLTTEPIELLKLTQNRLGELMRLAGTE